MNVQNVFHALKEDQDNHALGIVCAELEKQGYQVLADGQAITSDDIFDGGFEDLANKQELKITLQQNSQNIQEFTIKFVDFHVISINP